MTKKIEQEEELSIPMDLLDKDPLQLAESEEDIQTIVTYLRATRENIRATEKAGKRITSKSSRTKPKQYETNVLDMLIKEA
jgi:hypothetical protein|tara:strand:+ start:1455 stop:1697 length:243 start_codon:yes stop_codon:yes gene_type:complete